MKHVAIIIVNWNGREDTVECLTSVNKLKTDKADVRTIVVDNGSADDSVAIIKEKFPWVEVVENHKNLGFSGGNNIGIRSALAAGAQYVWLLNNDTVVDEESLGWLLGAIGVMTIGVAGSKIYFYPGREFHKERYQKSERGKVLWYAGGLIDWKNMYASHRGVDEIDRGQYEEVVETEFVTGCSMLVKREVFEKIGLLDERFFLYLEDLDFCLRAKRAGFKLIYTPSSKLWHKNAGSTDRPGHALHQYYFTRNRLLIGMRYAPLRTKFALIRESLGFLLSEDEVKRRAVVDALSGRFGERYIWKNT